MKIIKYVSVLLLAVLLGAVGYVYALTFRPEGRLDWGQALFLKLVGNTDGQITALKKMTVQQRSHILDAVAFDLEGLKVDTLKITNDSLTAYIFKPQNLTKNSPVVVYFHGGAFIFPWTNLCVNQATLLARSLNAVVVAVDYRVAPEHPFPTPNDDCYATLLWTIENVAKWGGNPNQLIVAGESAGATLATMVAIKAQTAHLTNIKYQILECPVTYIPLKTESYQKLKRGYFLEESQMQYALESYLPNKADYTNPLALPFYADSLSNLPPTYVITCEFDPTKDTGRDYVKKLQGAKVPIIHKEMKGMAHCIPGPFNQKEKAKLYDEMAKEAKKVL